MSQSSTVRRSIMPLAPEQSDADTGNISVTDRLPVSDRTWLPVSVLCWALGLPKECPLTYQMLAAETSLAKPLATCGGRIHLLEQQFFFDKPIECCRLKQSRVSSQCCLLSTVASHHNCQATIVHRMFTKFHWVMTTFSFSWWAPMWSIGSVLQNWSRETRLAARKDIRCTSSSPMKRCGKCDRSSQTDCSLCQRKLLWSLGKWLVALAQMRMSWQLWVNQAPPEDRFAQHENGTCTVHPRMHVSCDANMSMCPFCASVLRTNLCQNHFSLLKKIPSFVAEAMQCFSPFLGTTEFWENVQMQTIVANHVN